MYSVCFIVCVCKSKIEDNYWSQGQPIWTKIHIAITLVLRLWPLLPDFWVQMTTAELLPDSTRSPEEVFFFFSYCLLTECCQSNFIAYKQLLKAHRKKDNWVVNEAGVAVFVKTRRQTSCPFSFSILHLVNKSKCAKRVSQAMTDYSKCIPQLIW